MRVLIIGGGEIGYALCAALSAEHDVFVVDNDPDVAGRFAQVDSGFVEGSGTSPDVLPPGTGRRLRPIHRLHAARRGQHRRLFDRQSARGGGDGLFRVETGFRSTPRWHRKPARALWYRSGDLAGGVAGGGD